MKADIVVIGGGPAGLAAAIAAKRAGAASVMILERDVELGGILNQCIHHGFGLHKFRCELTGPEYAHRYIEELKKYDVDVKLNTMALSVSEGRVCAINPDDGYFTVEAGAVVLAMGCRERTRGALCIPGDRPSGIFTAGAAQRYVNLEGQMVGRRVLILGSGDIGLIMARRLTLNGARVLACVEIMPYSGGLERNIVQCLDDFGIPLMLSHTITAIKGKKRVESATVAQVDKKTLKPIPGTERDFEVDTILLSVGLIPENELSAAAGVQLDRSGGIVCSDDLMTSAPGIFACGNVAHVHDLADNVSKEAEQAGAAAAQYALNGREGEHQPLDWEKQQPKKPKSRAKDDGRALTCIICPRGCAIRVVEGEITGNGCKRGLKYAQNELSAPKRTLTSTVRIEGAIYPRIPVRTAGEIPKELVREAARQLEGLTLASPVKAGEVVLENILGTGIDVIATKDL